MMELSAILESDVATRVFVVSSIAFIAFYLAGLLWLMPRQEPQQVTPRTRMARLAAASFLVAVAAGAGTAAATGGKQASIRPDAGPSISIETMHRQANARMLPMLEVREPF
jgi:hypothetical protein